MTKEREQAMDMAIMDLLIEFRIGKITLLEALKEIKQACAYYTGPEDDETLPQE